MPQVPTRRRGAGVLVGTTIALLFVGAGVTLAAVRDHDSPSLRTVDSISPPRASTIRYRVSTMVLESAAHGPELCLGGVAESLPPQCGGVPVTNWRWDDVTGEERANQSIWGEYDVVGGYDGTSFTLTETPGPFHRSPREPDRTTTPCPAPDGGWRVLDPALVSDADTSALSRAARVQPDFAGIWIDDPNPPDPEGYQDLSKVIWNVAFTGDLTRHETELREVWGGALCVSRVEPTDARRRQIQTELIADESIHALSIGSASGYVTVVHVGVVLDDGALQARLDERYGRGAVKVDSALKRVP